MSWSKQLHKDVLRLLTRSAVRRQRESLLLNSRTVSGLWS
jgi:hypothetical protein